MTQRAHSLRLFSGLEKSSPFVRSVRIQDIPGLTGKWVDGDNVFSYIESGEADFILGEKRYRVARGHAVVIPPFQPHVVRAKAGRPFVQCLALFDLLHDPRREHMTVGELRLARKPGEGLEGLFRGVGPVLLPTRDQVRLERMFRALVAEYGSGRPGRKVYMKAQLLEILSVVASHADAAPEGRPIRSWENLERAIMHIQTHGLSESCRLTDVAAVAALSPAYLTTLFKRELGSSVGRYLAQFRLECAEELLSQGTCTVTEVARRCGYSSIYVFERAFKRHSGRAPGEYAGLKSKEKLNPQKGGITRPHAFASHFKKRG